MTAAKFPWEQHAIYEPPPIKRRTWRPHPIIILAALAIVSGALVALAQVY